MTEQHQSVATEPRHPAVAAFHQSRNEDVQLRVADAITAFAGSMPFLYIHALVFVAWMVLAEGSPWPTLTLVVSLEAIFLSTFVMISQNRADERRQVLADNQWTIVQFEESQNEQLIALSRQILALTQAIHDATGAPPPAPAADQSGS